MIKSGSCSIVLGREHFKNYLPVKKNKLVKITKIQKNHNEFRYLPLIREIENYNNFYSIPDETPYLINPGDNFYKHVEHLARDEELEIFGNTLQCFYVDFAGDKELLDTILGMSFNNYNIFWRSYKDIDIFTKTMLESINYLHQKKICHLDIKPENIMINTRTRHFKIIDFGFTDVEPFNNYASDFRGTPGYFPKYFPNEKIEEWLPIIEANDLIEIDGELPLVKDRKLIYKVDSFCLGRTLYFLKYIYDDNRIYYCYNLEKKLGKKLDSLIEKLNEKDVYKRITINDCLDEFY
jgi:serine/threonine protein kinase